MSTVKVILNTRHPDKKGLCPIIIRVREGAQKKDLPMGKKVEEKWWKEDHVSQKHPRHLQLNSVIKVKLAEVETALLSAQLQGEAVRLDKLFQKKETDASFTGFLKQRQAYYEKAQKLPAANKYRQLIEGLEACFKHKLTFKEITAAKVREWDNWMIAEGLHPNTRNKKLSTLRQAFTKAIMEGVYLGANPFTMHEIKRVPVKKAKLSEGDIAKLEGVDLTGRAAMARDLFLFSYYCKGMRFENVVTLKKANIVGDRIVWQTNKGKSHLSVKLTPKIAAILSRYSGPFLFPYIKQVPEEEKEYKQIVGSVNAMVNDQLKIVAGIAGIAPISFHIARHSFANNMKIKNVPISAIKDLLGHTTTRMTENYLAALGDEHLDEHMDKL